MKCPAVALKLPHQLHKFPSFHVSHSIHTTCSFNKLPAVTIFTFTKTTDQLIKKTSLIEVLKANMTSNETVQ